MSGHAGLKTRGETLRLGQPFYIPKCAYLWCREPLSDSAGNPRWDLIDGRFVCLRGCRTVKP